MNDSCVMANDLSKHFLVLRQRETAFRMIKSFIRRESLMRKLSVLSHVSFEIKRGERVAVIGKNGAGKTTLMRLLAGIYKPSGGEIHAPVDPKVLLNFWTGFSLDLSVVDNVDLCGTIFGGERMVLSRHVHRILEMAELSSVSHSPVKRLSLGQIQRLSLSIFLNTPGDFLIFDECLAFVDKGFLQKSDGFINGHITDDKTVIMASHDGDFLKKHCTRAIWLDEGRIRMDGEAHRVISEYERAVFEQAAV